MSECSINCVKHIMRSSLFVVITMILLIIIIYSLPSHREVMMSKVAMVTDYRRGCCALFVC